MALQMVKERTPISDLGIDTFEQNKPLVRHLQLGEETIAATGLIIIMNKPEHWQPRMQPQKVPSPSWQQKGFTLLELLVVVVIVAILFSYTTLAIRGDSPEDLIKEESSRLKRLVELALEESILRGEEYGIEVHQNGYQFLRYTQNQWEPIAGDRILRQRTLPNDMELEMRLEETEIVIELGPRGDAKQSLTSEIDEENNTEKEAEKDEETSAKPQIFLLSSGEITPEFDIRFYILGVETSYIVKGFFDGTMSAERSEI